MGEDEKYICREEMISGEKYNITFEDRFIEGYFEAIFLGWINGDKNIQELSNKYINNETDCAVFDNGVRIYGAGWEAKKGMTQDQINHLEKLIVEFTEVFTPKYKQGVKKHGGNLWEKSEDELLDCALEEALDQIAYLLTLKQKRR